MHCWRAIYKESQEDDSAGAATVGFIMGGNKKLQKDSYFQYSRRPEATTICEGMRCEDIILHGIRWGMSLVRLPLGAPGFRPILRSDPPSCVILKAACFPLDPWSGKCKAGHS